VLAFWGAALSSVLAALQVIQFIRNRARLRVAAEVRLEASDAGEHAKNASIAVSITNHGWRSAQILGVVLLEGESETTFQIISSGFPVVLQPATQVEAVIQIEWLHYHHPSAVGVVDALGGRHLLSADALAGLVASAEAIPSTVRYYRRRDDPAVVVKAFQVKDATVRFKRARLSSRG